MLYTCWALGKLGRSSHNALTFFRGQLFSPLIEEIIRLIDNELISAALYSIH